MLPQIQHKIQAMPNDAITEIKQKQKVKQIMGYLTSTTHISPSFQISYRKSSKN